MRPVRLWKSEQGGKVNSVGRKSVQESHQEPGRLIEAFGFYL